MRIDYKLIGGRIKAERKSKGYTQERLAEKLDVSVGYISQVERGITKISLDLLGAIAAILHCDLSLLVTGASVQNQDYLAMEIQEIYEQLTPQSKSLVIGFLHLLKDTQDAP